MSYFGIPKVYPRPDPIPDHIYPMSMSNGGLTILDNLILDNWERKYIDYIGISKEIKLRVIRRTREVYKLRREGLTYKQVSQKTDVSSGTVGKLLAKQCRSMRNSIKDYLYLYHILDEPTFYHLPKECFMPEKEEEEEESKELTVPEAEKLPAENPTEVMLATMKETAAAIQSMSKALADMNEKFAVVANELSDLKRINEESDYEKQGYDGRGLT